ncbi:MAG: hypothetical protein WC291_00930 [Thermodesulfovibrionales bacterium]
MPTVKIIGIEESTSLDAERSAIRGTLDLLVTAYGFRAVQEEIIFLCRRQVLAAAARGIFRRANNHSPLQRTNPPLGKGNKGGCEPLKEI